MTQNATDGRVEALVGNLLRVGVALAATVVLLGGVLFLWQFGLARPDYASFHGEPAQFRELRSIWNTARQGNGLGLIQLGLAILIATPIARVAFSVLAFARERDVKYAVFATIVLGILIYGLFGFRVGG